MCDVYLKKSQKNKVFTKDLTQKSKNRLRLQDEPDLLVKY